LPARFCPFFRQKISRAIYWNGSIGVAAAERGLARKFWLNDLNRPLTELLELAIEQPWELANFYTTLWLKQTANSLEHSF